VLRRPQRGAAQYRSARPVGECLRPACGPRQTRRGRQGAQRVGAKRGTALSARTCLPHSRGDCGATQLDARIATFDDTCGGDDLARGWCRASFATAHLARTLWKWGGTFSVGRGRASRPGPVADRLGNMLGFDVGRHLAQTQIWRTCRTSDCDSLEGYGDHATAALPGPVSDALSTVGGGQWGPLTPHCALLQKAGVRVATGRVSHGGWALHPPSYTQSTHPRVTSSCSFPSAAVATTRGPFGRRLGPPAGARRCVLLPVVRFQTRVVYGSRRRSRHQLCVAELCCRSLGRRATHTSGGVPVAAPGLWSSRSRCPVHRVPIYSDDTLPVSFVCTVSLAHARRRPPPPERHPHLPAPFVPRALPLLPFPVTRSPTRFSRTPTLIRSLP